MSGKKKFDFMKRYDAFDCSFVHAVNMTFVNKGVLFNFIGGAE